MKDELSDLELIKKNYRELKRICEAFNVKKLFTFGSLVTGNFRPDSDIDFLVDFNNLDPEKYTDNYFELKFALENLFHRKIDLLETKALKNPFLKKSINASKRIIYGN